MAIILNDNVQVNLGKPVDNKYLQPILNKPYINIVEVNTTIIEALRYTGLTVNILGVEYWYGAGVTDIDLVVKMSGGTGTVSGITGGTNVGIGEEVFSGVTDETTMLFKTIIGTGGTTVNTIGDTIYISGGTSTPSIKNVIIITGGTYSIILDDDFIGISGVSTTIIELPTVPYIGKEITISDVRGNALTSNVTINGDSTHTIEGATFATINTDYGGIGFLWNGFTWSIIAVIT